MRKSFSSQRSLLQAWIARVQPEGYLPHREIEGAKLHFRGVRLYDHLGMRDIDALIAYVDVQHTFHAFPMVLMVPPEYLPGSQLPSAMRATLVKLHGLANSHRWSPLSERALLVDTPDLSDPAAHANNVRSYLERFERERKRLERARTRRWPQWVNQKMIENAEWYQQTYAGEIATYVEPELQRSFDVLCATPKFVQ